jgi:hypothetical protein
MNFVNETTKPSTARTLHYMTQVCRAMWADHRAAVRAYKADRRWAPASAGTDPLYLLAVACALVTGVVVLVLTAGDLWGDFSAWLNAGLAGGAAAVLMPGVDIDAVHKTPARSERVQKLHDLAGRPQGVNNPELQAALGIDCHAAGQLLFRGTAAGLAKRRHRDVDAGRVRWFTNEKHATDWFESQAKAAALVASPPPTAKAPAAPKKRGRELKVKPPTKAAQAAQAARLWATQDGVITANTRVVIAPHSTAPTAPPVPGWGKPPPVREGALDYKRHMHQAQAFVRPAHITDTATAQGARHE